MVKRHLHHCVGKEQNRIFNVNDDYRLQLVTNVNPDKQEFVFEETTEPEKPAPISWQDASIFEINKLAPHATFMPYASTELLKADAERYENPGSTPRVPTGFRSMACGNCNGNNCPTR